MRTRAATSPKARTPTSQSSTTPNRSTPATAARATARAPPPALPTVPLLLTAPPIRTICQYSPPSFGEPARSARADFAPSPEYGTGEYSGRRRAAPEFRTEGTYPADGEYAADVAHARSGYVDAPADGFVRTGDPYAPYAGPAGTQFIDPYTGFREPDSLDGDVPRYAPSHRAAPSARIDDYAQAPESYGQDSYVQSPYETASYETDSYGADSYGADSYGPDSYDTDSYGADSYGLSRPVQPSRPAGRHGTAALAEPDLDFDRPGVLDPEADLDFAPPPRSGDDRPDRTAPPAVPPRRPADRPKVSLGGKAVRVAVIAALVGGVGAYAYFDKSITLSVDGSVRQITSFASTVAGVLSAEDITVGSHDEVSPAPAAALVNNATVTVRFGRPVNVTVNGVDKHVWVHATTVAGALQELGVRTVGAWTSEPLSTALPRSGGTFSAYTLRHITFLVDGKTVPLQTTAATVTAAMKQAGIVVHNQDAASVPGTAVPYEGETISILRITGSTETKQINIPFTVVKEDDPNEYVGAVTVITDGHDGVAPATYSLETVNGVVQPPKLVSETTVTAPVNEVEKVGTESLPANVADLDWAALAQCESGGNPQAVDPSGTYFGLYQFSVATWQSLGGVGNPAQATPAEQTDLAELLYERSGSGQWPVCGPNLFK